MVEPPSLIVVIPAYNAERTLSRAVCSVLGTAYENLRIVIVDDGSTDGTLAQAERLCMEYVGRCVLLRHPDHARHGVSASRNLGIKGSQSEWIAFLDSDDIYLPHRFECFEHLTTDCEHGSENFDAVYEIAELRTEGVQNPESHWWRAAGDMLFGIRESLVGPEIVNALLQARCWATSAIVVRRSLLARTGVFDPTKSIAEDCHLWLRIAAVGRVIAGALSSPVSVYFRHGANSYEFRVEHHLALLRAMLDAWRWARAAKASNEVLAAFADGVPKYAMRSVVAARDAGRADLATRILRLMLQHQQIGFFSRKDTWRQIVALGRGYLGRQRAHRLQ